MINFGVVGFGYWGPNIVRCLNEIQEATVKTICDLNPEILELAKGLYPNIQMTTDVNDIIQSDEIDVVAVVTPVSTHFDLAKKALENGKHIFVEKPFTTTIEEAEKLIELGDTNKLKIMVDHTFLFTGAVQKIKELIDTDVLGDLYYFDSRRISLGLFQHDTNVIWDLAPHDLSIIDYVVKNKPIALTAQGMDHMGSGFENIAYITMYFENNMIAHINVNWLSPVKIRTTMISGEKRMLVWDDLHVDEKIKIYDKGIAVSDRENIHRLRVDYRSGDIWSPRTEPTEALKTEMQYLIDCFKNDTQPFNDGHAGLRIVKLLQAADQSLKNDGKKIKLCQKSKV